MIAGIFYLIFIIFSFIADYFASFALGDTTIIINKMIASGGLFTIGIISNLFSALFFLLAAWALYVLLKPINKNLALLFLLLNLVGVAVQSLSTLHLFAGLEFLKIQLNSQAISSINLYKNVFMIAQIFYGTWLFPLGYLIYKSKFIPKFLGTLLIIDGFAVLLWFFQFFLLPSYEIISYLFLTISLIAEFSLVFWLLFKSVKFQNP